MFFRKADLAAKYGIPVARLELYERVGLLTPIQADDHTAYAGELRVSVIAKAEALGFTFDEIRMLLTVSDDTTLRRVT